MNSEDDDGGRGLGTLSKYTLWKNNPGYEFTAPCKSLGFVWCQGPGYTTAATSEQQPRRGGGGVFFLCVFLFGSCFVLTPTCPHVCGPGEGERRRSSLGSGQCL